MNSKQVIRLIEQQSNKITSDIIKDLIKDNKGRKLRIEKLYSEYLGDVEITRRKFIDETKVNSKLPNDYRGDIVDGITGYMFGVPVSYDINKANYRESELKKLSKLLNGFKLRNSIDDLDSTTGEMMSICGMAARLLYIDLDGKERVTNINPWEVVFVMDSTIDEVQYAMIYYEIDVIINGETKKRIKVEWYDKKKIYYFIEANDGSYIPDNTTKKVIPHMFDGVPVLRFINNNALKGDFEKVADLIDAYDRSLSDNQNEVEEFRLAYLAFYGVEPTKEVIAAARETGAFGFPESKSETSAEFLTKNINAEFLKDHKKTLNDNIYKFSKTVDMTDENFSGGAMSGESRKWKLVNLENRAKSKERKFIKALRTQFKILSSAWSVKNIKLNYEDVTYQFTRNLPVDLLYHADATEKLKGNVSEKTRLSLLPFVEDVETELLQIEEEAIGVKLPNEGEK